MYLTNPNQKLQIVLGSALTTLNMPVITCYSDSPSDDKQTFCTTTNGVTTVDIVPATYDKFDRTVKTIQVYNADTAAKVVQISLIDNGVRYQIIDMTLAVDDTLGYALESGWYVVDVNGNRKSTSTISGIISTSPSTGIGYGTGAGGAVIQITSRATAVTVNNVSGTIQTDVTSLAAGASAEFTVTNSRVAIGDVVVVSQRSGSSNVAGVAGVTHVSVVTVAAGSFIVSVDNKSTTTAETGAIIINFAVIKAVSA